MTSRCVVTRNLLYVFLIFLLLSFYQPLVHIAFAYTNTTSFESGWDGWENDGNSNSFQIGTEFAYPLVRGNHSVYTSFGAGDWGYWIRKHFDFTSYTTVSISYYAKTLQTYYIYNQRAWVKVASYSSGDTLLNWTSAADLEPDTWNYCEYNLTDNAAGHDVYVYLTTSFDYPPGYSHIGGGAIDFIIVAYSSGEIDTQQPQWDSSTIGVTNTEAGRYAVFYSYWTDDNGLGEFIFSTNMTGIWENETSTDPWEGSPTEGWANVTEKMPNAIGSVVGYRFYCCDLSGSWNSTLVQTFKIINPNRPYFRGLGYSATYAGWSCDFWVTVKSDVENLAGYIFGCNVTGTWMNDTWTSFGYPPTNQHGITVTRTLPSDFSVVVWAVYVNDASDIWGWTGDQYLKCRKQEQILTGNDIDVPWQWQGHSFYSCNAYYVFYENTTDKKVHYMWKLDNESATWHEGGISHSPCSTTTNNDELRSEFSVYYEMEGHWVYLTWVGINWILYFRRGHVDPYSHEIFWANYEIVSDSQDIWGAYRPDIAVKSVGANNYVFISIGYHVYVFWKIYGTATWSNKTFSGNHCELTPCKSGMVATADDGGAALSVYVWNTTHWIGHGTVVSNTYYVTNCHSTVCYEDQIFVSYYIGEMDPTRKVVLANSTFNNATWTQRNIATGLSLPDATCPNLLVVGRYLYVFWSCPPSSGADYVDYQKRSVFDPDQCYESIWIVRNSSLYHDRIYVSSSEGRTYLVWVNSGSRIIMIQDTPIIGPHGPPRSEKQMLIDELLALNDEADDTIELQVDALAGMLTTFYLKTYSDPVWSFVKWAIGYAAGVYTGAELQANAPFLYEIINALKPVLDAQKWYRLFEILVNAFDGLNPSLGESTIRSIFRSNFMNLLPVGSYLGIYSYEANMGNELQTLVSTLSPLADFDTTYEDMIVEIRRIRSWMGRAQTEESEIYYVDLSQENIIQSRVIGELAGYQERVEQTLQWFDVESTINNAATWTIAGGALVKFLGWAFGVATIGIGGIATVETETVGTAMIAGGWAVQKGSSIAQDLTKTQALSTIFVEATPVVITNTESIGSVYLATLDLVERWSERGEYSGSNLSLDVSSSTFVVTPTDLPFISLFSLDVQSHVTLTSNKNTKAAVVVELFEYASETIKGIMGNRFDTVQNVQKEIDFNIPLWDILLTGESQKAYRAVAYILVGSRLYGPLSDMFIVIRNNATSASAMTTGTFSGQVSAGESSSQQISAPVGADGIFISLDYGGSDLDLHLYDAQGRHVGVNYQTGEVEFQIPGANYSGPEATHEWISVANVTNPQTLTATVVGVTVDRQEDFSLSYLITSKSMSITPVTIEALSGQNVSYEVSVMNLGETQEMYDLSLEGLEQDWYSFNPANVTLEPGQNAIVRLNVTLPNDALPSNYTISVFASNITGSTSAHLDVRTHDVNVTNLRLSRRIVGEGYDLNMNATISNEGSFTETFNVIIYANATTLATFTNCTLESGQSTTITFDWNTTGFTKGNYTICVVADTVSGETHTADNNCTDGSVYLGIPGDVNADHYVGIDDIFEIASHFGAEEGQPHYDPVCDINGDGYVGIDDIFTAARHFGQENP